MFISSMVFPMPTENNNVKRFFEQIGVSGMNHEVEEFRFVGLYASENTKNDVNVTPMHLFGGALVGTNKVMFKSLTEEEFDTKCMASQIVRKYTSVHGYSDTRWNFSIPFIHIPMVDENLRIQLTGVMYSEVKRILIGCPEIVIDCKVESVVNEFVDEKPNENKKEEEKKENNDS